MPDQPQQPTGEPAPPAGQPLTEMVEPLAESENLADLLNEDGTIK